MATVFDALIGVMEKEGQNHIKALEKLVRTRRDKKRIKPDGKPNLGKQVKFLKDVSYSIKVTDKGITIIFTTERIEGSLLDVTREYMKLNNLSEPQYSAYAVAKSLAVKGVSDVVPINNRRLRGVIDRIQQEATNIQIKAGLDVLKNFTLDNLNMEV